MRHLCALIAPPDDTFLDCFAGAGSTLVATRSLGLRAIGIQRHPDYVRVLVRRVWGVAHAGRRWQHGSSVQFVLAQVARYARSSFPSDEVYGPTPALELRVITYGGLFNPLTQRYSDNILVFEPPMVNPGLNAGLA